MYIIYISLYVYIYSNNNHYYLFIYLLYNYIYISIYIYVYIYISIYIWAMVPHVRDDHWPKDWRATRQTSVQHSTPSSKIEIKPQQDSIKLPLCCFNFNEFPLQPPGGPSWLEVHQGSLATHESSGSSWRLMPR